jgi:predicted DNA-binding transcriptional regulator AlpA
VRRIDRGTQLLTLPQVARRIGFSTHTIKKWVTRHLAAFPQPMRIGPHRSWRWREIDIETWIDRCKRKPAAKRMQGVMRDARS